MINLGPETYNYNIYSLLYPVISNITILYTTHPHAKSILTPNSYRILRRHTFNISDYIRYRNSYIIIDNDNTTNSTKLISIGRIDHIFVYN